MFQRTDAEKSSCKYKIKTVYVSQNVLLYLFSILIPLHLLRHCNFFNFFSQHEHFCFALLLYSAFPYQKNPIRGDSHSIRKLRHGVSRVSNFYSENSVRRQHVTEGHFVPLLVSGASLHCLSLSECRDLQPDIPPEHFKSDTNLHIYCQYKFVYALLLATHTSELFSINK